MCLVPPILLVLLHHPCALHSMLDASIYHSHDMKALSQYDLSSLEYMLSGAAPLSMSLMKALTKRLQDFGARAQLIQSAPCVSQVISLS